MEYPKYICITYRGYEDSETKKNYCESCVKKDLILRVKLVSRVVHETVNIDLSYNHSNFLFCDKCMITNLKDVIYYTPAFQLKDIRCEICRDHEIEMELLVNDYNRDSDILIIDLTNDEIDYKAMSITDVNELNRYYVGVCGDQNNLNNLSEWQIVDYTTRVRLHELDANY